MTYHQEILNRLSKEFSSVELRPQFPDDDPAQREQVFIDGQPMPVFMGMHDVNNLVDWYGAKALDSIAAGMALELHDVQMRNLAGV